MWNVLYLTDDWNNFTTMVTLTNPSVDLTIFNFATSTIIPNQEGIFIKDFAHDYIGVSDVKTSGIKINLSFRIKEDWHYITKIRGVNTKPHYSDVIMSRWRLKSPASRLLTQSFIQTQIKEKHQSSASLAFVHGIHRWPVNFPHKGPVTRIFFHLMTSSWLAAKAYWIDHPLNSSPPGAAYMHQRIGPALVQIRSYRLCGPKPLSEPILGYYQLE